MIELYKCSLRGLDNIKLQKIKPRFKSTKITKNAGWKREELKDYYFIFLGNDRSLQSLNVLERINIDRGDYIVGALSHEVTKWGTLLDDLILV